MSRNKLYTYIGGHSLEANPICWPRHLLELEQRLKARARADDAQAIRIADRAMERVKGRLLLARSAIERAQIRRSLAVVLRIQNRVRCDYGARGAHVCGATQTH